MCRTGESREMKEIDREVKMTVVDRSKTTVPFIIEGPATSDHESFSYKVNYPSVMFCSSFHQT